MLHLAKRASQIRLSPIRAMTVECQRVGGVNLAQGVCDTPVPERVRRAAQEAIEAGANTYSRTEGVDALRRALARKMARDNGLEFAWDREIVVTSGATGAFYAAALAILEPGDEVLLFEPFYGYHTNTLALCNVAARFVSTGPPDWGFSRASLEAARSERTRAILVNTPCNPSGKVFTRDELACIRDFACDHDLFVFTDEVYEHFVFGGAEHVSPATLEGMRERTITMSALSKTFAITGWRLGWLAADARWMPAFAAMSDLVYVCAPTPLQVGAAVALEALDRSYFTGIGAEYEAKRDQLCAALTDAGLPPFVPDGTYFVLADISCLPGDTSDARVMALLERTGVAAVPGSAFYCGPPRDDVARFCFGKTPEDLDEACRRLRQLRT